MLASGMATFFGVLVGGIVLVTLPTTLELLLVMSGLLAPARRREAAVRAVRHVKVVVPAHNEEALIGRCVESLRSQESTVGYEIVVVADNCSDRTGWIAEQAGARVLVRTNLEERGKGFALRFAFESLSQENWDAVVIVDADSVVSPNLIEAVARRMAAGAEAVQCRYQVLDPEKSLRKRLLDVALLAFNVLRPLGRNRWGLSVGLLGNGFALTKDCLSRVPYRAFSVVEDLEYHLMLVRAGLRVDFEEQATVYGEMPGGGAASTTQRARWEGGRLRMAREYAPGLATSVIRGQTALLEPLLELLTLPLAFYVALLALLVLLPVSAGRMYGLAGGALVLLHVLTAAQLGGKFWTSCRALAAAPLYVAWKLAILPAVLRSSRKKSHWIRTERDVEGL